MLLLKRTRIFLLNENLRTFLFSLTVIADDLQLFSYLFIGVQHREIVWNQTLYFYCFRVWGKIWLISA